MKGIIQDTRFGAKTGLEHESSVDEGLRPSNEWLWTNCIYTDSGDPGQYHGAYCVSISSTAFIVTGAAPRHYDGSDFVPERCAWDVGPLDLGDGEEGTPFL